MRPRYPVKVDRFSGAVSPLSRGWAGAVAAGFDGLLGDVAGLAGGRLEVGRHGMALGLVAGQETDAVTGQEGMGLEEGGALLALVGVVEPHDRGEGFELVGTGGDMGGVVGMEGLRGRVAAECMALLAVDARPHAIPEY